MRVVICDEVDVSAERGRRRRNLLTIPIGLAALLLPLVFGTRNIPASTWRWTGPATLVGLAVYFAASLPVRRRRVSSAIVQMRASWTALVFARPADLERFGSVRGESSVRSFGTRQDFRRQGLEVVVGIDIDGTLGARTVGGPHLPALLFGLEKVDELRLAVDEDGIPRAMAFVDDGDSLGYRILKPVPDSAPHCAVDERSG